MMRRSRRTGWDIVASGVLLLCVGVASVILLLEANGYLIDFDRLRVEPSSLLVLRTSPRNAPVTLDGSPLAGDWDASWQISPGRHELLVESPDRHPWQRSFHVPPRRAAVYQSIILYWTTVRLIDQTPLPAGEEPLEMVDPSLRVTGGEIRVVDGLQSRLVTRFSRPVLAAHPLDESHLIVQLESELHVVDLDGSNDRILLTLPDPSPRLLRIHNGGRGLGIVENEIMTTYELY